MNIGDKIGSLTVIEVGFKLNVGPAVKVKCECGSIHTKAINYLKHNKFIYCSRKCGLLNPPLDLEIQPDKFKVKLGEKYNRWTIIDNPFYVEVKRPKKNRPNWRTKEQYAKCECDCGSQRNVSCSTLINGKSKSCGCITNKISYKKGTCEENGFKICCHCQKNKSIENFQKVKRNMDGFASRCKDCKRIQDIAFRHGVTKEFYDELFEKQKGKCAICKAETSNCRTKSLSIDHCHKTGKIRGLLCSVCNTGLGKFKDSIELLNSAIDYINNAIKGI